MKHYPRSKMHLKENWRQKIAIWSFLLYPKKYIKKMKYENKKKKKKQCISFYFAHNSLNILLHCHERNHYSMNRWEMWNPVYLSQNFLILIVNVIIVVNPWWYPDIGDRHGVGYRIVTIGTNIKELKVMSCNTIVSS